MSKMHIIPRRGSTDEAARILGCSASLVRWLIRTGEIRNVERPGKRMYLLDLDEVQAYHARRLRGDEPETLIPADTAVSRPNSLSNQQEIK